MPRKTKAALHGERAEHLRALAATFDSAPELALYLIEAAVDYMNSDAPEEQENWPAVRLGDWRQWLRATITHLMKRDAEWLTPGEGASK